MPSLDDAPLEGHLAQLQEFNLKLQGLQSVGLCDAAALVLYQAYVDGAIARL